MKKVTYFTEDGGAIHEYIKEKNTEIDADVTVVESDDPGIYICITGNAVNKISTVVINFKEDE